MMGFKERYNKIRDTYLLKDISAEIRMPSLDPRAKRLGGMLPGKRSRTGPALRKFRRLRDIKNTMAAKSRRVNRQRG